MKEDYQNKDKEESDRKCFEFNQVIEDTIDIRFGKTKMLSPDFEGAFGISRNSGKKLGKGLAALEYFLGLEDSAIPDEYCQLISEAYGNEGI
jgi:hypothetical protein